MVLWGLGSPLGGGWEVVETWPDFGDLGWRGAIMTRPSFLRRAGFAWRG